jgi:hypothetical protein
VRVDVMAAHTLSTQYQPSVRTKHHPQPNSIDPVRERDRPIQLIGGDTFIQFRQQDLLSPDDAQTNRLNSIKKV